MWRVRPVCNARSRRTFQSSALLAPTLEGACSIARNALQARTAAIARRQHLAPMATTLSQEPVTAPSVRREGIVCQKTSHHPPVQLALILYWARQLPHSALNARLVTSARVLKRSIARSFRSNAQLVSTLQRPAIPSVLGAPLDTAAAA